MNRTVEVFIDGQRRTVPDGASVAVALALSGDITTRLSITGSPRAPFCGMGVCQECRVCVNGRRVLACQTPCVAGMQIERTGYARSAL